MLQEKKKYGKIICYKTGNKKVRHLKDITINLSDTTSRHLIFTGKNGSGKTSVLDAIAAYLKMKFQVSDLDLEKTKRDGSLYFEFSQTLFNLFQYAEFIC